MQIPIPILNIGMLIQFFICVVLAVKIFVSYRKKQAKNTLHFFYGMSLLSISFLLGGIPSLKIFFPDYQANLMLFGALNIAMTATTMIAAIIFTRISFNVLKKEIAGDWYLFFGMIMVGFVVFLKIANLGPMQEIITDNYIYWLRPAGKMNAFSTGVGGITILVSTILSGTIFLINGINLRSNKLVFRRAMFFSSGLYIFTLSGLSNLVIGANPHIVTLSISVLLNSVAFILFGMGVLYRVDYD